MLTFKEFSKVQSASDSEGSSSVTKISRKAVPMQLGSDDATRRLVVNSAKRVIKQHHTELEKLAYK